MNISSFLTRTVVLALLVTALSASHALARKGGGGGGGGGGDGGDHSSYSGGSSDRGSSDRGSSHSFSRGSSDRGSWQSFSRGSSDHGSSQSFSRGSSDHGSSQSFSRGPSLRFDQGGPQGQSYRAYRGTDRGNRDSGQSHEQLQRFLGQSGAHAGAGPDQGRHESYFRGGNQSFQLGRDQGQDNRQGNRFTMPGGDDRGHRGDWSDRAGGPGQWSRRFNARDFERSADNIRRQWKDRDFDDDRHHPFHSDWWSHYDRSRFHGFHGHTPWDWAHFRHAHGYPYYWWTWVTAPRLTTWFSYGWPRPYYWDYGPGEYIYVYDDVIYVNGQWYMPAREYYQRSYALVERVPEITPQEAAQLPWQPLGVFALTPEGANQSDLVIQLAVTKDGTIGGTLHNQTTGETFAVEGTVEKATQRAVWSYVDAKGARILMETGIYNLTKPETTALVHFGPDAAQIWQMVRLEQPQGAGPSASQPAPSQPAAPSGSTLPGPVLPPPN